MKDSKLNKEQIEIRDEVQGYLHRKEKMAEYTDLYPDTDEKSKELNILARTSIQEFENYAGVLLKEKPTLSELRKAQIEINKEIKNTVTDNDGGKEQEKWLTTIREILGEEIRKQSKSSVSSLINKFYSKLDTRISTKEEREDIRGQIDRVKLLKEGMETREGGSDPRMLEAKLVLFFDSEADYEKAKVNGLIDSICETNGVSKEQTVSKLSSNKVAIGRAIGESKNPDRAKIYDLSQSQDISSAAKAITNSRVSASANFLSIAEFSRNAEVKAIVENITKNLFGQDYAKSVARAKDAELIKDMVSSALTGLSYEDLNENKSHIVDLFSIKIADSTIPTKVGQFLTACGYENHRVELKSLVAKDKADLTTDLENSAKEVIAKAVIEKEKAVKEVAEKVKKVEKSVKKKVTTRVSKFFQNVKSGWSSPSGTPKVAKVGRTIREPISKF